MKLNKKYLHDIVENVNNELQKSYTQIVHEKGFETCLLEIDKDRKFILKTRFELKELAKALIIIEGFILEHQERIIEEQREANYIGQFIEKIMQFLEVIDQYTETDSESKQAYIDNLKSQDSLFEFFTQQKNEFSLRITNYESHLSDFQIYSERAKKFAQKFRQNILEKEKSFVENNAGNQTLYKSKFYKRYVINELAELKQKIEFFNQTIFLKNTILHLLRQLNYIETRKIELLNALIQNSNELTSKNYEHFEKLIELNQNTLEKHNLLYAIVMPLCEIFEELLHICNDKIDIYQTKIFDYQTNAAYVKKIIQIVENNLKSMEKRIDGVISFEELSSKEN